MCSVAKTFSAETDDDSDDDDDAVCVCVVGKLQQQRKTAPPLVKLTRVKIAFLFSPQVQPPRATDGKCYTSQPQKKS